MEITAIIPARGGSTRIPGKNLLPLAGESLLGRKIRQLSSCRCIDRIVVGSEDDDILNEAQRCGAETVRRPKRFCDERICSANDMIANFCELVLTDIVIWCHCTNPLLSAATYQRAVEAFMAGCGRYVRCCP